MSDANTWWRRLAGEPLVHFLLIGAVLFIAARAYQAHTDIYRIEVTPAHVAQLAHKYALQFGGPPDAATLEQIVQEDIHDEVLFRQGKTLKLDADDEIVRRRVVQKAQFLLQNLSAPADPTEAQLRAYYQAHAAKYAEPPRVTFSHIYFAADKGGDAAAEARARAALARLKPGVTRAPDLGDPFPDIYDFSGYDAEQVARVFGHTPLIAAVLQAPVGRWSGPYRSAYGWHLLYVSARTAAGEASFDTVADRVRSDYAQTAQDAANAAAFAKVARRFTVVRADKPNAPAASAAK